MFVTGDGNLVTIYANLEAGTLEIAMPIAFALAGLAVGWVYFSLMRYSLTHLDKNKAGIMRFVALALLRVVLFGGGALGALLVGAWCLIAYLLGFILARTIAVGRARTPPGRGFSPITSESRENDG